MDGFIGLLILLILVVPFIVGIWLIARAVTARNQIEELSRRVDDLQSQLARLKHAPPAAAKSPGEKPEAFTPAPLPPRKAQTPPAPAAAPTPPPIPVIEPEIPPLTEPIWPTAKAVESSPTPEMLQPEQPPIIPPPPVVPPPLIPGIAPEPAPEPVLETAQASTNPSDTAPPLPEKASLEMQIGTYWLVRIGVVIVLAGLAFFANLAYHNLIHKLGPGGKISLLYLASGLLLGAGAWWLWRNVKESLKTSPRCCSPAGLRRSISPPMRPITLPR